MTPEEARRLWVKALRSREYRKGSGSLRSRSEGSPEERFCCLGVACDVYQKHALDRDAWHYGPAPGGLSGRKSYTFLGEKFSLPAAVQEWLGLKTGCGAVKGMSGSLLIKNDSGYTFEEIAELIESGEVKIVA